MKSLKIILLFDLAEKIAREDYHLYWNNLEWKTEKDVRDALLSKGHQVIPFGLYDDIENFLKLVNETQPDLIFNMSEAYRGKRDFEPNIAALMELVDVPFTGAGTKALQLCKDKGLTKMILDHYGISTPQFVIIKNQMGKNIKAQDKMSLRTFKYPALIKPLQLESSEGISQNSLVKNEKEAFERVQFIHEKFKVDAIVEEYIEGKEVYVSILGNEKLTVFPPRELHFKKVPQNEPKFATYKVKWDKNYRKKWGIDTGWAKGISEETQKELIQVCKVIYKVLNIQGFGRIDLRIKDGQIYFIEANPNPSISKKEDYALSASKAGVKYDDLIEKIVSLSLAA